MNARRSRNNWTQFLQEDNGRFSSTRLVFVAWTLGILIIWGVKSWNSDRGMVELPESIQVVLGILMTGKVAQKFGEEDVAEKETTTATVTREIVSDRSIPPDPEGTPTSELTGTRAR